MELLEKLRKIKEKLTDPFNIEGVDSELIEVYNAIKDADKTKVLEIVKEFEDIKDLLNHNIKVIDGSLEIFIKHFQKGIISRRV